MRELLWAHVVTNLRFFARSRLIIGFAVVVTVLWAFSLVPFFLFDTSGQRFGVLQGLADQLHGLAWFCGAGLGLLALSTHLRSGTTRVLFARPAPPELWLASVFLSAFLVALSVHALAEAVNVALSLAWGVPYQLGSLYVTVDHVFETMIVISMLTALAAFLHPVLAVLLALFANDSLFHFLRVQIASAVQANGEQWWTTLAYWPATILYSLTPMLDPFEEQMSSATVSLHVSGADWLYLGATAGYTALAVTFFFCLSALAIRRRSLA